MNSSTSMANLVLQSDAIRKMLLHNGRNNCRQREFVVDVRQFPYICQSSFLLCFVEGFTYTKISVFTYRKNSLYPDLHSLNACYKVLY
jgi:hypothetical protein